MVNNLKRIIIAAVSKNGVIGNNNELPWYSKEELNHFKNTTFGFPIIMGRKTFDSIGKILVGRKNIVITNSKKEKFHNKNLLTFNSIKKAYKYLRSSKESLVFICGGGRIYRNVIKHADEMIISHMNICVDGDLKFPRINLKLWEVLSEKSYKEFTVKHYVRKLLS